MVRLVLGPMLRYADATRAVVWVETDGPATVGVAGHDARTFSVAGRHYALVTVTGLQPDTATPYEVHLDGRPVWSGSALRTMPVAGPVRIAASSCHRGGPQDDDQLGPDALRGYAEAVRAGREPYPHLLMLLGDQIYADLIASPRVRGFLRHRHGPTSAGLQALDLEGYARVYADAWSEPAVRWLLSTVPTAMVFDDHEVIGGWNVSAEWLERKQREPWWDSKITAALGAYWLYQHLGNLDPDTVAHDPLLRDVREQGWPVLQAAMRRRQRWSYARDLAGTRLVVVDCRSTRVLEESRRSMLSEPEWRWLAEALHGDCAHLVLVTSLPVLLPPGIAYAEAWDEATAAGVWGSQVRRLAHRFRHLLDLEHWSAFDDSFRRLWALLADVAAGRRGTVPRSVTVVSGDVHYGYTARATLPGPHPPVWQVVTTPLRNPLPATMAWANRFGATRAVHLAGWAAARLAGVGRLPVRWRLVDPPEFRNQITVLEYDGATASKRSILMRPHAAPVTRSRRLA